MSLPDRKQPLVEEYYTRQCRDVIEKQHERITNSALATLQWASFARTDELTPAELQYVVHAKAFLAQRQVEIEQAKLSRSA
jgi:hypothetical protein